MKGVKKVPEHILAILSRMEQDENRLKKYDEQLDRKDYVKLNEVLSALGGKWTGRKVQAHVFDCTAGELSERMEAVLNSGEFVDEKKLYEFFETPDDLADRMVKLSGLKPHDLLLEPSAGRGALLAAAKRAVSTFKATVIEPKGDNTVRLLAQGYQVVISTFEEWQVYTKNKDRFDVVLMNPPFQKACEHTVVAYSLLRPGGVLVGIMPSSIEFRQDRKYATLRALIEESGSMERLSEGTFKGSGTGVNTCLIEINA